MKLVKIMSLIALSVLVMVVSAGCSSSEDTTAEDPPTLSIVPDFTGTIIETYSNGTNDVVGSILVEGKETIQSSDKYDVTVRADTTILGKNDQQMPFADLEPGQQVKIWFSGPVKESYPAQVEAAQVIITGYESEHQIELGDEFELKIGQSAEISDAPLEIVFQRVIGDSRCPANARCVWQGEVSVEIEITGDDGTEVMTLIQPGLYYDYSTDIYETYEISFKILPYPESEDQITNDEYRLVLIIDMYTQ